MRLLLDTHIFLWYVSGSPRINARIRDAVRTPENDVYLSVASLWEVITKHRLGKLDLPGPPETFVPRARAEHQIKNLDIDEAAVLRLADLPGHHRDPFDRLLICQAVARGLTIITEDHAIRAYDVSVFDV